MLHPAVSPRLFTFPLQNFNLLFEPSYTQFEPASWELVKCEYLVAGLLLCRRIRSWWNLFLMPVTVAICIASIMWVFLGLTF